MKSSASESPSPRSILLLASIAGACWFLGVAALCLTPLMFLDQHAHSFVWVPIVFAAIAVAILGVAITLSIVASSRLRRLLGNAQHAA
jgi:hypothetical protein